MRWLWLLLCLCCAVPVEAQVVKTACDAAQLLPALQQCAQMLAQLTASHPDFITIPRATYQALLAEARELALLKSELAPLNTSLSDTADRLSSPLIH